MPTTQSLVQSPRYRALIVVAAGVVGFGLNLFPVYVYGGVWLFVGQIPALSCALLFGPVYGLIAALGSIAGLLMGALSVSSFVTPTQAMTWTLLLLEVVAVGEYARRRGPITAILLFWGVLGAPVGAWFLYVVRSMPPADVALVVGKNVLSGIFNVGVAAILSGRSPFTGPLGVNRSHRDTIESHLNARVSSVVTLPVLIVLIVVSRWSQRAAEQSAKDRLQLETAREARALGQYLVAQRRVVELLSRVSLMPVGRTAQGRSDLLHEARASNTGFLTLMIADSAGTVRSVASKSNDATVLRATNSRVADRPYFSEPMRTARPFLSAVFRGRGLGADVVAAVSAPIIEADGKPIGVVEGSLDLAKLHEVLSRHVDLDITVVDQEGRVAYSSAPERRPILSDVPNEIPRNVHVFGRLFSRDPKLITSKRETYYAVAPAALGWSVLVETPRWLALKSVEMNSTAVFLACIVLFAGSLWAVRFVNRAVAEPLVELERQAASLQWGAPIVEADTAGSATHAPREIAVVRDALSSASRRISESFLSMQRALSVRDHALQERDLTVRNLDTLVHERTLELENERDRAAEASRAKSAFLANMSHELRTPLNVMLGRAEAFADGVYGPLSPQQGEAFAEIDAQGRHLLALIGDILDLARIESGKLAVDIQQSDALPVLQEVVASFQDIAKARRVTLTLDAPTSRCIVHADLFRLRQVVVNLVSNAVKFTSDGGRVQVSVEVRTDSDAPVAVHVTDTGIGIAVDRIPVIFGPFEQADASTTRVHGGAGLGLTISRALADAMGMRISVTSQIGVGSTFTLHFAATENSAPAHAHSATVAGVAS